MRKRDWLSASFSSGGLGFSRSLYVGRPSSADCSLHI
jgi:hypothetical protein